MCMSKNHQSFKYNTEASILTFLIISYEHLFMREQQPEKSHSGGNDTKMQYNTDNSLLGLYMLGKLHGK